MNRADVREAIARAHREEWARVVAALTRRFGDLDVAEEAAAEAFATAVERWPAGGVPPNPGAWLTITARRKAIDRLRAKGHWVFAGGLASPSTATVIDNRGGEALFTDGPFLESKKHLIGLWIIEAPDLDVALKLAAEGSKACNAKVEVRPFLDE